MNNIRMYRIKAGITQQQLAAAAKKSIPCISQYENGVHTPPIPVAKAMANVLGCKWYELLEEDG